MVNPRDKAGNAEEEEEVFVTPSLSVPLSSELLPACLTQAHNGSLPWLMLDDWLGKGVCGEGNNRFRTTLIVTQISLLGAPVPAFRAWPAVGS